MIGNLQTENNRLKFDLGRLSDSNEALHRQRNELDAKLKASSDQNNRLQEENASLLKQNKDLGSEITTLHDKLHKLENDLQLSRKEQNDASAARTKLADLHAQMGAALQRLKQEGPSKTSSPAKDEGGSETAKFVTAQTPTKPQDNPSSPTSPVVTRSGLPQRPPAPRSVDQLVSPRRPVSIQVAPLSSTQRQSSSSSTSRRDSSESGRTERRRPWFED